MAYSGGRLRGAQALFEERSSSSRHRCTARGRARLGPVWMGDGLSRSHRRGDSAHGGGIRVLSGDEPDEDLAILAAELGRVLFFTGQEKLAAERIEFALEMAESLGLPARSRRPSTPSSLILYRRRSESPSSSRALCESRSRTTFRRQRCSAYYNLTDALLDHDPIADAVPLCAQRADTGPAARRALLGGEHADRSWESRSFLSGEWDAVLALAGEMPAEEERIGFDLRDKAFLRPLTRIYVNRGGHSSRHAASWRRLSGRETSADLDERAMYAVARAVVARAEGCLADAVPGR